jgi:hypothetical protein
MQPYCEIFGKQTVLAASIRPRHSCKDIGLFGLVPFLPRDDPGLAQSSRILGAKRRGVLWLIEELSANSRSSSLCRTSSFRISTTGIQAITWKRDPESKL